MFFKFFNEIKNEFRNLQNGKSFFFFLRISEWIKLIFTHLENHVEIIRK